MNKINWTDARIGDSALVTSENKMGVILKDYGRKFHLRFADGSEKTYDASELNFFNTDDDYKRGGSIKKGDVYQWNTVEYDSKKGNNYKVVKNIEITDIDSKGQVIGRVVGTSNQFIIRDPQKNLKSKVSKMETGGDIERGGAHMYIELKDSNIVVYHGDAFKIYKNAKPMFVISSAKKGSWDELWQSIRSIQSSNTDGQKGSAHLYVKLSNGDITVYHGDDVRQFRKLDEDERLFLQKNVRKDSWDRVYNTLMNLKSVKMENGGMAGKTHFQPVIRKDKNNPNFLYIDIYYPEGKGILSIGQSKTMFGREREEGALKALQIANSFAKQLEAKYNIEDIEVNDLKNGKVQVFAVSDDFVKMRDNLLNNIKMEDGGMVGQEIVFDDNGERNTGVIKEIHEITGDYIVATDDGRTVLAQKEFDVISLGKMRKQAEAKRRFSFFEDGGNIAKENKEMIDSQTIEARHHVEELSKILTKKNKIEPWVVARMERATTDLSDVTHYLEGKKMAKGGGVDGYSMNNIYRSSMRTRGNRTYIELHNSNNLNLSNSLLNKIKNLIQSYSRSAIVKALKNENGDYYFSVENSMITKKSKEFNTQLEKLMKSNKFYSADVELVKPKDGLFWSGEINEDYFDLWIYAMNIKKYIKLLNKTETISLAEYNKTKEQLNKYESETFKRWNKESRDAESSGDLKKYQSNNQKRWRSEYIYERGGKMENGGGIKHSYKITQEGNEFIVEFLKSNGELDWGRGGFSSREEAEKYALENRKYATGGGVGSKLKATYIPNRNIDELKTVFGQSIKGKDLIDGAYTTRKGIKQKPKMARTMFEEETYEYSKGGSVKNFELDKRLAEITLKVLESQNLPFGEEVYMNLMNRDLIKRMYGERLPRGFAGPTSFMLIGAVLNPLTGKSVYMDGSQLIVGNDAVMTIKYGTTTWKDVIEKLHLQSSKMKRGGKMAHGGMTEHGLRRGDTIVYNQADEVMVIDKKNNQHLINLDKGERYNQGGKMSTGGAVKKNGVNQFAEDEKSEGYEAKVFLGKFDGRTFKAQSTDKTWDDGTPVTKYFSRNGFKDVKLKGEYQLVDSDRGHWYIQGPRNVWYAVRHKDYGTPPFEFGKGGMMPGWKHKAKK